ncbi:MAG: dodecin domain-containing protein [Moraxellaceae bacterium]|nr:MAG: dodecin domain-containing protein [Moraxellaceae bacterium]
MSIAKNIEVSSTSTVSFEDAIKKGIERVSKTVNNVKGAWIKEQKVDISNGQITQYNVTIIITFVLDESENIDK